MKKCKPKRKRDKRNIAEKAGDACVNTMNWTTNGRVKKKGKWL
tara:strand:+ start:160 stop:288 length:129 start_codon:yes stop_codon:yes gene_type:complete